MSHLDYFPTECFFCCWAFINSPHFFFSPAGKNTPGALAQQVAALPQPYIRHIQSNQICGEPSDLRGIPPGPNSFGHDTGP